MNNTAPNNNFLRFLQFGFLPDDARASKYLCDLINQVGNMEVEEIPAETLLCRIVEDKVYRPGAREVQILLSAGLDSRGLLGASLRIFPASAIHCYTYGHEESVDYRGAAQICQRLGVAHTRIEPNELPWEMNQLIAYARYIYQETGTTPPVDGLKIFASLAERMDNVIPVLSGYFGDTISGHALPLNSRISNNPAQSVDAFVKLNTAISVPGYDLEEDKTRLKKFLYEHEVIQRSLPHMTYFDVLNFAWRQALRIRPVVMAAFQHAIAPYEDPRWIRYWLMQPVAIRHLQKGYRIALKTGFPEIFSEISSNRVLRQAHFICQTIKKRARPIVPWRLRQKFQSNQMRKQGTLLNRGDPRCNPGLRRVLQETAEQFDRRGILPQELFLQHLDDLLQSPNWTLFKRLCWMMSAEVHYHAGNFDQVQRAFGDSYTPQGNL